MNMERHQDDESDTPVAAVVVVDEVMKPPPPPPLRIGMHAHWDCFSGAAGDMMLAACLDAVGVSTEETDGSSSSSYCSTSAAAAESLLQTIEQSIKLGLPELANEFRIECQRVWRGSGSIAARHVTVHSIYQHRPAPVPPPATQKERSVVTTEQVFHSHHQHDHQHHSSHSHDHLHAATIPPPAAAAAAEAHAHTHDHNHQNVPTSSDVHDEHSHTTNNPAYDRIRNLPEIRQMLHNASELYIPPWVRDHAIRAFTELARAEAAVHGAASLDQVHFHEVGAVDSIVDTVGTLLALHHLNVTTVSCSRLPMGEGMVSTAHGILPVPAPATLRLMTGMPMTSGPPGRTGELVTPTAAALLRVLVQPQQQQQQHDGRPPNMTLRQVGIGAGTKDFRNHPNIIRLLIGEQVQ